VGTEPPDDTAPGNDAIAPPPPVTAYPRPEPWTARSPKLPLFRLVVGAFLVVGGALWLLDALNVFEVSFLYVLTGGLILVGLALIVGSRTGRHSGLIIVGIVLTVVLAFTSSFDIRLEGGVGQRVERPISINRSATYRLSVGMLTIDLRNLKLAEIRTDITATVGIGQLVVQLSPEARVQVRGRAGAGDLMVFGQDKSGLDLDRTFSSGLAVAPGFRGIPPPYLVLDLQVGIGQITVTR
jgi:hypothetical protein